MHFRFKNREIECHPGQLVGIINVTPDSFSDAGQFLNRDEAVAHGMRMLRDGAAMLDIGGESTRPGAPEISSDEEIRRIIPVIKALKESAPDCVISADTRKSPVAIAALAAGADIINDVSGLRFDPALAEAVAATGAGIVLMHSRAIPKTMQQEENLNYSDVLATVIDGLLTAAEIALRAGIGAEQIILDPGIGFAKTSEQNLALLAGIDRLRTLQYPVMVGHSRKSFIGRALDLPEPETRDFGTAGVAIHLARHGVEFIRVHNVRGICDAIAMYKLSSGEK